MQNTCLYIHGLDSFPWEDKMEVIAHHAKVEAEHIDYRNTPSVFHDLSQLIEDRGVSCIIGSSFGGFLGYWLSNKHNIPALLFNPVIGKEIDFVELEKHEPCAAYKLMVLGQLDDVVDPIETHTFLNTRLQRPQNEELILRSDMAHRIDMNNFKRYVNYYFDQLG